MKTKTTWYTKFFTWVGMFATIIAFIGVVYHGAWGFYNAYKAYERVVAIDACINITTRYEALRGCYEAVGR